MLTDKIQEKLRELSALPGVITVGLSKKIISGTQTDIIGITFGVKAKEINPENMLPTSVDIDGVTYVTDVIEVEEVTPAVCTVPSEYNHDIEDYIQSGMSYITSFANKMNVSDRIEVNYFGTFGFVAYDTQRQVLVGVTTGHLNYDITEASTPNKGQASNLYLKSAGSGGYYAFNYVWLSTTSFRNGYSDDNGRNFVASSYRFKPLKVKDVTDPNRFNQVDTCLTLFVQAFSGTSLLPNRQGTSLELYPYFQDSWKSYHVKGIPEIVDPMPFATPAELNALVSSPPSFVSSTGCGSGVKHGAECGLKIDAVGITTSITFTTMPGPIYFDELISFSRITSGLPAVLPGDSGAALVAKIGGIWKIIGMVIAGNETTGYACRIDNIASQLGIEAWDGTVKPFMNLISSNSGIPEQPLLIAPGVNNVEQLNTGNRKYHQVGTITLAPRY